MMMLLPDGSVMQRTQYLEKPQHEWTADEVRQHVAFQELHLRLQREATKAENSIAARSASGEHQ